MRKEMIEVTEEVKIGNGIILEKGDRIEIIREEDRSLNRLLLPIAKKYLSVDTLETRNSDSSDFYECSVWGIRKALTEAYELGQNTGGF